MIKARKENVIILGMSDENLERLNRKGSNEPIKFNLKDLGLQDMDVIIFNGESEESMYMMMLDNIGPNTKLV